MGFAELKSLVKRHTLEIPSCLRVASHALPIWRPGWHTYTEHRELFEDKLKALLSSSLGLEVHASLPGLGTEALWLCTPWFLESSD